MQFILVHVPAAVYRYICSYTVVSGTTERDTMDGLGPELQSIFKCNTTKELPGSQKVKAAVSLALSPMGRNLSVYSSG